MDAAVQLLYNSFSLCIFLKIFIIKFLERSNYDYHYPLQITKSYDRPMWLSTETTPIELQERKM